MNLCTQGALRHPSSVLPIYLRCNIFFLALSLQHISSVHIWITKSSAMQTILYCRFFLLISEFIVSGLSLGLTELTPQLAPSSFHLNTRAHKQTYKFAKFIWITKRYQHEFIRQNPGYHVVIQYLGDITGLKHLHLQNCDNWKTFDPIHLSGIYILMENTWNISCFFLRKQYRRKLWGGWNLSILCQHEKFSHTLGSKNKNRALWKCVDKVWLKMLGDIQDSFESLP